MGDRSEKEAGRRKGNKGHQLFPADSSIGERREKWARRIPVVLVGRWHRGGYGSVNELAAAR